MEEQLGPQIADTAAKMAAAVEAIEKALDRLMAQQESIEQKIERIVATIDERCSGDLGKPGAKELNAAEMAQLERENQELKLQAQRAMRKTVSPLVSTLLSKSGYEESEMRMEAAALDKILGPLSMEQRIAIKAEMARAGMIE